MERSKEVDFHASSVVGHEGELSIPNIHTQSSVIYKPPQIWRKKIMPEFYSCKNDENTKVEKPFFNTLFKGSPKMLALKLVNRNCEY